MRRRPTPNASACLNLSQMSESELAELARRGETIACSHTALKHYLVITPEGRLSIRTACNTHGYADPTNSLSHVLQRFLQLYTATAA